MCVESPTRARRVPDRAGRLARAYARERGEGTRHSQLSHTPTIIRPNSRGCQLVKAARNRCPLTGARRMPSTRRRVPGWRSVRRALGRPEPRQDRPDGRQEGYWRRVMRAFSARLRESEFGWRNWNANAEREAECGMGTRNAPTATKTGGPPGPPAFLFGFTYPSRIPESNSNSVIRIPVRPTATRRSPRAGSGPGLPLCRCPPLAHSRRSP